MFEHHSSSIHLLVEPLLDGLTDAMTAAHLLSEQAPSEQALSSKMPFCCDTMSFENWLQFVFLPKMSHLISRELPLPEKLEITPMAEQSWAVEPYLSNSELDNVFSALRDIDDFFAELNR